jgi:hypothetical protein
MTTREDVMRRDEAQIYKARRCHGLPWPSEPSSLPSPVSNGVDPRREPLVVCGELTNEFACPGVETARGRSKSVRANVELARRVVGGSQETFPCWRSPFFHRAESDGLTGRSEAVVMCGFIVFSNPRCRAALRGSCRLRWVCTTLGIDLSAGRSSTNSQPLG